MGKILIAILVTGVILLVLFTDLYRQGKKESNKKQVAGEQ